MKEKSKKMPLAVFILVWVIAICAVLFVGAFALWNKMISPVSGTENEADLEFDVNSGDSVMAVADRLEKAGVIRSSRIMYYVARFNLLKSDGGFNMKKGHYVVKSSMSLRDIMEVVQTGTSITVSVSIPEGLTKSKVAKLLEESGICSAEDFMLAVCDRGLLAKYQIPAETFEGFLFPETYFFTPGMAAEDVLRKMVDTFFEKARGIPGLLGGTPEEIYTRVILASVVEREYQVAEEAPLISSVFINRVNNGIGLESCATVEYIITEVQGKPHPERIFYSDLEIDSPYNTYKYRGLPPGPISNPGTVALNASANPAGTDYFYFVKKDPRGGSHNFSKTLSEHNRASKEFYTKRAAQN